MHLASRHVCYILVVVSASILWLSSCQNPVSSSNGSSNGSGSAAAPGRAQWARTVSSGSDFSEFTAVAEDSAGNVYAAGFITGTAPYSFGNSVSVQGSSTGQNPVLVKYDSSGTPQWAVSATGGTSDDSGFYGVAVDASGNVYAVGTIGGTTTYGFGNSISAVGVSTQITGVLVKYSSAGIAQWAAAVGTATGSGGTAYSSFSGVAIDASGNIDVDGALSSTYTYPFGSALSATGTALTDPVFVQYDSSGTPQWVKTITSGTETASYSAVAVDGTGNIYAAGQITGPGTDYFGPSNTIPCSGTAPGNVLLVKYDASGNAQWADTLTAGGNGPNSSTSAEEADFTGVAVDSSGNVYATGTIDNVDPFAFGPGGTVTVSGPSTGWNLLLVKYDSSGAAQWARSVVSGPFYSYYNAVAVDGGGSVFAAGDDNGLGGTFDFGDGVTNSAPGFPNLLVRYDGAGTPQWADAMVSAGTSQLLAIDADPASTGPVYAAGWIASGDNDLGGGVTVTGVQGENALLIRYAKQ